MPLIKLTNYTHVHKQSNLNKLNVEQSKYNESIVYVELFICICICRELYSQETQ